MPKTPNEGAPGANHYFPLNTPAIGTVIASQDASAPKLFQPITIKGVEFKNRIFVSPMCQFSSDNGHATPWHLVHIGGFATRGAAGVCMEATAVSPEGRISPQDAGIWQDSQIEPLKPIIDFAHAHGTKIGIQLAHAGRKASCHADWVRSSAPSVIATAEDGGWPEDVWAPSAIPYNEGWLEPKVITEEEMQRVEEAYVAAVKRCEKAGFDYVEIHGAYGYLIHNFLSPLTNTRTDSYGGSLENRMRYPLRIIKRVREAWTNKPLFVRVSGTDWHEAPEKDENGQWRSWGAKQLVTFAKELYALGVDVIDTSTGGNYAKQKAPTTHGYPVPFAAKIKEALPSATVGVVGSLSDPKLIEQYLQEGKIDVAFLARAFLRNPHWPIEAARELGVKVKIANQYERAWPH